MHLSPCHQDHSLLQYHSILIRLRNLFWRYVFRNDPIFLVTFKENDFMFWNRFRNTFHFNLLNISLLLETMLDKPNFGFIVFLLRFWIIVFCQKSETRVSVPEIFGLQGVCSPDMLTDYRHELRYGLNILQGTQRSVPCHLLHSKS